MVNHNFESLFNLKNSGILVFNENKQIEMVNSFVENMLGFNIGELIKKPIDLVLSDELLGSFETIESDEDLNKRKEILFKKKDGSNFLAKISVGCVEQSDNFYKFLFLKEEPSEVNIKDQVEEIVKKRTDKLSMALRKLKETNLELEKEITHRKMLETQARLAFSKEKELNQLKSKFVSMASHEFRTPLSCILTSVSLLDHYIETGKLTKSKKHISIIKKSIRNLSFILDDFLSYDNINQGRVKTAPTDFYLKISLEDIVKSFKELNDEYNISYSHKGEDIHCFQCLNMIKNTLNNLISNSIKYSNPNDIIKITSELVNNKIQITITDNGIGIPLKDQTHIFDTFFRGENVLVIPGTGLGLAIVKSCLNLIGGNISFESIENKETKFYINFPAELNS